jgi:PAS domain S-box-containing protein
VVGIIGLANKPGGFDENDARLATAFGELAAIALFNSRTLEMLENSEERFRSVAQNASDAIISYNSLGNVILWNDAAEEIFGYPSAEMLGQPFSVVMPPHVQETHEHKMRRALASDKPTVPDRTIETTGLRKDGSPVPIELSLATWQTKEGRFYTSIIRDITERKQSEAALRQAQDELERRIQERVAMEERQRLARELHDSVSQALYGISLGAHTALTLFDSDRDKVVEALNYVLSLANAGLTEMRALLFELRPESLELEGLVAALGKQAAALQARHGLEVGLEVCDEPDLPLEIKEAVYRIAQEALQNAVKHARPNRLDVRLNCSAEGITLEVCDNGVGFDPMASFPGHLGLRSMRERAARLGGTLDIASAPGCGTRIRVCIPPRAAR